MLSEYTARASQLAGLSVAATQLTRNPLDHTNVALIGMLSAQFVSILIALIKARSSERARRHAERLEHLRLEMEREERRQEREMLRAHYRRAD